MLTVDYKMKDTTHADYNNKNHPMYPTCRTSNNNKKPKTISYYQVLQNN